MILFAQRDGPAHVAAGLPLLMVAAFVCAYVTNRASPADAGALLLLLLPLYWIIRLPAVRLCDGWIATWLALLGIWLGWMIGLQAFLPAALPSGWWRIVEKCSGLVVLLVMLAHRPDAGAMIRLLGISSALSLIVVLAVNVAGGVLGNWDAAGFGFGNVNILMCTTGPALFAWTVVLVRQWRTNRPAWNEMAVWVIGWIALATIIVATNRRGPVLAMTAISLWFLVRWSWQRRPQATAIIGGLAMIAASVLLIRTVTSWSMSDVTGRNERISQYLSAFEGVRAGFPWGFGHYGALHLQELTGESTRHAIAMGSWGMHIHNEFLDTLLDGGPVALLLLVVLTVMTIYRVIHIRDSAVRLAFEAMGIAVVIHMLTDNTYGEAYGQVWMGLVLGMMWSAAALNGKAPSARWFPAIKIVAWPLVLVCMWGVTVSIYPAVLHREAAPSIRFRCLKQAWEPQLVNLHMVSLLSFGQDVANRATQRAALDVATGKMGWTPTAALLETRYRTGGEPDADATLAILRLLHFDPFNRATYAELSGYLKRAPDQVSLVPSAVQRRLMYLTGQANLPTPRLDVEPDTMDSALDLYAALSWHIANGLPWRSVSNPLEKLVARYGNIQGVALLTIQAAIAAPAGTFPWLLDQHVILSRGLQPETVLGHLHAITTSEQARAVVLLLTRLYPQAAADKANRTMTLDLHGPPESIDLAVEFYCQMVRVIRLAEVH